MKCFDRWIARCVVLVAAWGAMPQMATAQAPVTSEQVASALRQATEIANAARRERLRRVGGHQAVLDSLRRALGACLARPATPCASAAQSDFEQSINDAERILKEAVAEEAEQAEVAAAMTRLANNARLSQPIVDILDGRSAKLAAALGLTTLAATADASLAVDPRLGRLVFSTGRLTHCLSVRSVCDARPYSVKR